nr:hypothetical protein Itr_chr09CG20320 [Ipomoea trifida]
MGPERSKIITCNGVTLFYFLVQLQNAAAINDGIGSENEVGRLMWEIGNGGVNGDFTAAMELTVCTGR